MKDNPATLEHERHEHNDWLALCGRWTVRGLEDSDALVEAADKAHGPNVVLDGRHLARMDTAGALALKKVCQSLQDRGLSLRFNQLPDMASLLIKVVNEHDQDIVTHKEKHFALSDIPATVGHTSVSIVEDLVDTLAFLGESAKGLAHIILHPSQWRINSLVTQIDKAGWKAVPIITLMSFLIGAIVAQQSAFQLRAFGAEIYVVDLVGILVFREVGLLITAIMLAGRTGSSYTAELGSMKMREETDAMRVMGLKPLRVLVLPRLMALLIVLPVMTFIANIAAVAGGGIVLWLYSGIQPATFIQRLQEAVWLQTIMVGFIKTPFMALIIGIIACVEGFRVEGSAESLGTHVTSSVVKSIFVVIVADGIFAIFFANIGY